MTQKNRGDPSGSPLLFSESAEISICLYTSVCIGMQRQASVLLRQVTDL